MLDKIKTVTTKPVTTIINTHTHCDHTGNNNFFGTAVTIVAQENTKANMEKMAAFKDDNAQFLPSKTFKDRMTVGTGNDRDRSVLLRRRPHQRRCMGATFRRCVSCRLAISSHGRTRRSAIARTAAAASRFR